MSICVGSAWKILPITARSSGVFWGGGRESPVKHEAREPEGVRTGRGRARKDRTRGDQHGRKREHERGKIERRRGTGKEGSDKGSSTDTLCTGFTLVLLTRTSIRTIVYLLY